MALRDVLWEPKKGPLAFVWGGAERPLESPHSPLSSPCG
jgi:hypothetical protein